jgi:superfamily I DNA/RNA helicase
MSNHPAPVDKYVNAKKERQKHVDAVLDSAASRKIVAAGPGTGKTHLFKMILQGKKKALTLTFVNALVEDLALELYGLSHVSTLHSFARAELKNVVGDVRIFPKLPALICEDALLLLGQEINFEPLFNNREDESEHLTFYLKRRAYYAHYGYTDIILSAVQHFESQPADVPTFEQVVVDEFQDFNRLEVSLIDLLAEKSPVLLAGDDDQALYVFKNASTDHIRQRHRGELGDYKSFNLPFCSRCTRVIVETANDIVKSAKQSGHLIGRIEKPYQYFDDEVKDEESNRNPKIVYKRTYERQIPWYIQKSIEDIAIQIQNKFSVLVISPSRNKCHLIADGLRGKGFENIEPVEQKDHEGATLLDGLKLLLSDRNCNLGCRIVSKYLFEPERFTSILKKTHLNAPKQFSKILKVEERKVIAELLKTIRAVTAGEEIDKDALNKILEQIGLNQHEMAIDSLKSQIKGDAPQQSAPGVRKIPIKVTTIPSSKGLAAEYVFITHFSDQFFIKNQDKVTISDQDICNLLVAITRARRRVYLISTDQAKDSTFLNWIDNARIEKC